MEQKISRRSFVKKSVLMGTAALIGQEFIPAILPNGPLSLSAAELADIAVIKGSDFFENTVKAVDQIGGMKRFVSKGSRVGLLLNSPFKNYGAHVRPDVSLAAIEMCYEAGAKEIFLLKEGFDGYWKRSPLSAEYAEEIKSLKPGWDDFIDHQQSDFIKLDEPAITKPLLDLDVYINVSILKHHDGIGYTCTLKNMMGVCSTSTNMGMHMGGKLGFSFFPDLDHISQCIVDLNKVRQPDVCIIDATEFITEKGPYGPGKLAKPHLVIAGTDRVALDTYCSQLLGLDPTQLPIIQKAAEQELGNPKLNQINVMELVV